MKIYKYPFGIFNKNTLEIPRPAQILKVGEQDGELVLWAFVETGTAEKH